MRNFTLRALVLMWCALSVAWLPLMANAAVTNTQSPLTQASIFYRNEVLTVLCVLTMLLGAYISSKWNPPQELAQLMRRNSPSTNAVCSMAGGAAAFLYVLNQYNSLTILHPVWVLGCSFATPLTLQVAAPVCVQLLSKYLNRGGTPNDE